MENLDKAIKALELSISRFPIGVKTKNDYKSLDEKIMNLRKSFVAINARCLTLKAILQYNSLKDVSEERLEKSFMKLNQRTSNYLVNKRALSLCYHSQGLQSLIYKNEGPEIVQKKAQEYIEKLLYYNDNLLAKHKKIKELRNKQYVLKLESCQALYDYHEFLNEKKAKEQKSQEESNPHLANFKLKMNKLIFKICTMKRLMCTMIAAMYTQLHKDPELIILLEKHKEMVSYETIKSMALNESDDESS